MLKEVMAKTGSESPIDRFILDHETRHVHRLTVFVAQAIGTARC